MYDVVVKESTGYDAFYAYSDGLYIPEAVIRCLLRSHRLAIPTSTRKGMTAILMVCHPKAF